MGHIRRASGMADCDVHQKVPAVFLPIVGMSRSGRLPSSSAVTLKTVSFLSSTDHSQARRVCQRLDVILDGIMSIRDQGLELVALPEVARIGPVDDHVISAAAMGWQLLER